MLKRLKAEGAYVEGAYVEGCSERDPVGVSLPEG
jgi:hypothetical protein